jgi:hypothetical protein
MVCKGCPPFFVLGMRVSRPFSYSAPSILTPPPDPLPQVEGELLGVFSKAVRKKRGEHSTPAGESDRVSDSVGGNHTRK